MIRCIFKEKIHKCWIYKKELVQMKTSRRKWYTRWIAVCVAIVLGVGMYTGMPIHAATSAELTISQNGIDFIKEREGFNAKCYYDGAQSSIGYGTKCGTKAHASGLHSITRADAETAMRNEINSSYIPNVRRQTSGIEMNQNQFDALVSFTYNTGGGTSMIKNSPLVKYLRGEMSQAEATSAFQNYVVTNSATGKVDSGLQNRRRLEAELFFSGVNPNPDPPTVSSISIDKALYAVGENVVFHVSSDTATQYTIGIHKNGVPYEILWNFTESSYEYKLTEPGDYYAYLSASNSAGYKDSSGVWFTVYDSKPTTSTLLIPKLNYVAGEPVEFSFTSDNTETFTLGIHRNGVPFDIVYDIKENNYSYTFTEPGDYYAYLCSTNSFGYTNSNGVWFTVYNSAPSISILSTDKHTYSLGENIVFYTESDTATTYSIGLYKDGVRYDSFWDFTENEYMYTSIEPGEYSAYVTSYNSLGYKDSDYIYFTILPSPGDLNSDNKITSDDLFLLQSYLTNNITLTESQGKAADLNEDGLVDGFDLALLRQKLAA